MKNEFVLGAMMALNDIKTKDFTVTTAIKLRTIIKEITGKWEIVEEVRKSLIEKFCEKDKDGEPVKGEKVNGQDTVKIPEENRPAFNLAWKELLGVEVELSSPVLKPEDFGDTKVSAETLLALGVLVAD